MDLSRYVDIFVCKILKDYIINIRQDIIYFVSCLGILASAMILRQNSASAEFCRFR